MEVTQVPIEQFLPRRQAGQAKELKWRMCLIMLSLKIICTHLSEVENVLKVRTWLIRTGLSRSTCMMCSTFTRLRLFFTQFRLFLPSLEYFYTLLCAIFSPGLVFFFHSVPAFFSYSLGLKKNHHHWLHSQLQYRLNKRSRSNFREDRKKNLNYFKHIYPLQQ